MKLKNFNKNNKRWKDYTLAGCVCVVLYVCLTHLGVIFSALGEVLTVFNPVFLGFIVAYIVNPLAVKLNEGLPGHKATKKEQLPSGEGREQDGMKNPNTSVEAGKLAILNKIDMEKAAAHKKKARWTLSVVVALLIVFALIALFFVSLIPQMIDNIVSLIANAQNYINDLEDMSEAMSGPLGDLAEKGIAYISGNEGVLKNIATVVMNNMKSIITATTNFGSTAVNVLIGIILGVYFLMAKEGIVKGFRKLLKLSLKSENYEKTAKILKKFNSIFTEYIVCELIDALIIGVLNYLFMLACSMPDAAMISFVVGLTNLIPTFGPVIGAIVGGFILLLMSPSSVIAFLMFTLVLQSADSYVIKPKLFGNALNVPGFLILAAIIVFGRFMGVVGMLIAIPVAAILVYIYNEILITYLETRNNKAD